MSRIERRSTLLAAIRQYFHNDGVLEVTTPTLRSYGVTDPHLESICVDGHGYLQTSPEYAMKMLLAESGRSLYQVCPAYRGGETGGRHRIEFQMLEWYRTGFDLADLMDDVAGLLLAVADAMPGVTNFRRAPQRTSYRALFESSYGFNPHAADVTLLLSVARDAGAGHLDEKATAADCLDLLFSRIETTLVEPLFVTDYPACQAALSQLAVNEDGDEVSRRFELYAAGIELGNAYLELNDAAVLRERFNANNRERQRRGLPQMQVDEDFLAVVDRVPPCAGIAMGIDRLLMVIAGTDDISLV